MLRSAGLSAALCLLALACIGTAEAKRGMGTAYSGAYDKDATGFNSCQFGKLDDRWERYYAARPSQLFDRSECGKCIRARGTEKGASGDWVTVMIVDECASCGGDGDIDFSIDALKDITGFSWDRKGIEWEWSSCDGGSSTRSDDDSEDSSESNDDDGDNSSSDNDEEDNNNDEEDNKEDEEDSNNQEDNKDEEDNEEDNNDDRDDDDNDSEKKKNKKKNKKKKKRSSDRRLLQA